eukprot:1099587-Prymnesium_polylepis.1
MRSCGAATVVGTAVQAAADARKTRARGTGSARCPRRRRGGGGAIVFLFWGCGAKWSHDERIARGWVVRDRVVGPELIGPLPPLA